MAIGLFHRLIERRRRPGRPATDGSDADGTGTNATLIVIAVIFILGFTLSALFRQISGGEDPAAAPTVPPAPATPAGERAS